MNQTVTVLCYTYEQLYIAHREVVCLDTSSFAILSAFEPIGIAQAATVCKGVALFELLVVMPHCGLTCADSLRPVLLMFKTRVHWFQD